MAGRRYDLTNVEETQWINAVGQHTVKVLSVTAGKTSNSNPFEKVVFADKDGAQITDEFVVTDRALYRMKLFTKALKLPTVSDTDQWVGRYVKINTGIEKYPKQDGSIGEKIVIKSYEPSNLTNSAPKEINIEVKDQRGAIVDRGTINVGGHEIPDIDIDDTEIPF